jgi:hypothetical protein
MAFLMAGWGWRRWSILWSKEACLFLVVLRLSPCRMGGCTIKFPIRTNNKLPKNHQKKVPKPLNGRRKNLTSWSSLPCPWTFWICMGHGLTEKVVYTSLISQMNAW